MTRPLLSRKPVKLLTFFTLAFVVSLPLIHPFQVATAQSPSQNQNYTTEFTWNYGGYQWDWNLSIPTSLYDAYSSTAVPDSVRTQIDLSHFGYFTTTEDDYIQSVAQKFNETSTQNGYSPLEEANFVLAFVQSIPYKTDNQSTGYQDYPRFPVETLVDDVGDCKSHSILFATLMLILDNEAVYINPPDHLAVGLLENNIQGGSYWIFNNQTYYYCETTGAHFEVGDLPDQFNGVTANVYPIDASEQYVPNLQAASSNEHNLSINSNTPLPTYEPNPTSSMSEPTTQPVLPMSINLISDDPVLFALIILVIAVSIIVTIKTVDRPKPKPSLTQPTSLNQSSPNVAETNLESNKFCIYCGSSNKSFAIYCEKCGKKIG